MQAEINLLYFIILLFPDEIIGGGQCLVSGDLNEDIQEPQQGKRVESGDHHPLLVSILQTADVLSAANVYLSSCKLGK